MRAGCFAETRVIHLLNRRFVNFYYNTGGPGLGKDPAAAAFTKGKTKNVWAFYAAFNAAGDPFGVTDIYADKDNVFDFLVALLRANPEYDRYTAEEEAILTKAADRPHDAAARLAAGGLLEELGRYAEAEPHYRQALPRPEAYRGLLRLARYAWQWDKLEALAREIEGRDAGDKLGLAADVAAERGYRLNAEGKYADLRRLAEETIRRSPDTKRMAELRFAAGIACFFLKDKDRASYHWCWVVENIPDDRLARRCAIAAAHEGMPYPNPELGGYRASLPGGNIQVINAAYERARRTYERLKGSD
jgi:tetratricopeptide (TPR) repeat protein